MADEQKGKGGKAADKSADKPAKAKAASGGTAKAGKGAPRGGEGTPRGAVTAERP